MKYFLMASNTFYGTVTLVQVAKEFGGILYLDQKYLGPD
jgi:hypothetical protein